MPPESPATRLADSPARPPTGAFSPADYAAVLAAAALVLWASPALALGAGVLFALLARRPLSRRLHQGTKWLLQACVVLLGFGMNLSVVLRLGMDGSVFAAASISATLLLGWWLGRRMQLSPRTATLLSAGTAICGGSAIAAVSTVVGATEAEIAVSIGTVFALNAVALYVFPLAGHFLHLSQSQFGLWSGVAIHDISSVVGAALSYGKEALQSATAVKLSRTLWIAPLTLALALQARRRTSAQGQEARAGKAKMTIPWFIGLFLLASLLRSTVPAVAAWSPTLSAISQKGMILVLFLIGTSLSLPSLRAAGWRMVATGLALWLFISVASLAAILGFHLQAMPK